MKKLIAILLYIFTIVIIGINIYIEVYPNLNVTLTMKFIMAILIALVFWNATKLMMNQTDDKKYFKVYIWGLFIYYLWVLLNVLMFDNTFGRGLRWKDDMSLTFYIQTYVNLKPLYTIKNYWYTYLNGNISTYIVATNLLGNIIAFAPIGFFFPVLFKKMRNIFRFTFITTLVICMIEVIQLFTGVGSCDIDDLILNLSGALIVFVVMKIPFLRRLEI